MDLFDRLKNNPGPLGEHADDSEGYYMFPKLEGELNGRMGFNGKECIVWSVNNYLGLGNHPEVRKADAEAAAKWGLAYPMGARMMTGNTDLHGKLEETLAAFVHKEKAMLVNFGYQGIMSAIDAILSRRDVVVYDAESHACIVDAVRMHLGKRFAFMHNDMESLQKHLESATKIVEKTGGGILVISEGVFGMRGDQGKLREIAALKEKYNFRFMIDDAHGFGTLGPKGEGAGVEQGIQDEVDIYFSTFAKSMASVGGFLAADKEIIKFLKYNMRSQIFAKSLPMTIVAGVLKRFEMMTTDPSFKANLWNVVDALQSGLKERGFDIGNTNSCVTPVYMYGDIPEAQGLVYDLRENYRIFCSIVVYPVIPKGMILLRLIPTGAHTLADVEETLDAFSAIKEKLASGYYKAGVPTEVAIEA